MSRTRNIAVAGICAALVWLATVAFQLYIPETKGYFNIGESMVYASALLFGSTIGAFAGGVGSALADLTTGYLVYAPGTFIIKGIEGFVAGFLVSGLKKIPKKVWKPLILVLGVILSSLVYFVGVSYYATSGEPASITIGLPQLGQGEILISLPSLFWGVVAAIVLVIMTFVGLKADLETGSLVLAAGIAGPFMVLGYFLYEYFVLGFGIGALAEVPFNIGQVLVGILVATPLTKVVRKVLKIS
ncbi:MAG: ECF transporter S component [Thermoproteota archaeon]|nr:ECF transporter S component [Candidatus Brockarchaeota archaeon]